jgi:hypothetical protein
VTDLRRLPGRAFSARGQATDVSSLSNNPRIAAETGVTLMTIKDHRAYGLADKNFFTEDGFLCMNGSHVSDRDLGR